MNILNQFSYPLIILAVVVGIFIIAKRFFKFKLIMVIVAEVIFVVVAVAGFLLLRPGMSTVSSADVAFQIINNGKPTFVEFFSNYCSACLAAEPAVDQLVEEIDADFDVLRVDIHTPFGRELRRYYEFSFTPEFVLFDANGEEVWRDHIPPNDNALELALQ